MNARTPHAAALLAPIDLLFPRLQRVRPRPGHDGEFMASCPCPRHERGDQHPSLSVSVGRDGTILLNCHSQGCTAKEIVAAVGLTEADLFPRQAGNGHTPRPKTGKTYPTAEDAIAYVGRGIALNHPGAMLADQWNYPDATNKLVMLIVRWNLPGDSGKEFRPFHQAAEGWRCGDPPGKLPLYGLPDLLAADPSIPLYVVEGEGKAKLLRSFGLLATCSAHGAKSAAKTDWTPLRGRNVVILPDADQPGEGYAAQVAGILRGVGATARIVRLPGLEPGSGDDIKEFAELRSDDGKDDEAIRTEIEALAATAPEATDTQAEDDSEDIGFRWQPINSAQFDAGDYRPEWNCEEIQVARAPMVWGGTLKTLKTGKVLDLGVSQASAGLFLGRFPCRKAMRVAILSGESGQFTLQERRLCSCAGPAPIRVLCQQPTPYQSKERSNMGATNGHSRKHAFERTTEKPVPTPVDADGIPNELKRRPIWVLWQGQRTNAFFATGTAFQKSRNFNPSHRWHLDFANP